MKKEVQIHRVATDDCSPIGSKGLSNKLFYSNPNGYALKGDFRFHLYATVSQEVEPIKEGEYYIEKTGLGELLHQMDKVSLEGWRKDMVGRDNFLRRCRKIIATTDKKLTIKHDTGVRELNWQTKSISYVPLPQFQQSFSKEYCDKGGIDKVLVEYHFEGERCSLCGFSKESKECINRKDCINIYTGGIFTTKLNSDNTITIHPLEEKMYSKLEVELLFEQHRVKFINKKVMAGGFLSLSRNSNWIKENL
jgi:hypothetical protein